LGISLNTLRRRIAAGQIDAEQAHRPQGHVWQVYLHGAPTQGDRADSTAQQDGATTVQHPATSSASAAQAEALSTLVQATIATVLGPLVAELAASRQTNERQAQEIADLREDRGRLTAERDAALAAEAKQASILAAQPEPASFGSQPPTCGALCGRGWWSWR
jgi:hypothetical protein